LFERVGQQDQLQQIKNDPIGMMRQKGYKIPDNLAGNPQAMIMHLIQTGQVGGPVLQRIMPMIQKLTGK
jgi:hypothetical protein